MSEILQALEPVDDTIDINAATAPKAAPAPVVEDNWEEPKVEDEGEGEGEDTEDGTEDAEWEPKVQTEVEEKKEAKVPSFRVREIREKADKEIKERDEKLRVAEEKATRLEKELAEAKTFTGVDLTNADSVRENVRNTDPKIKEINEQIAYLKQLGSRANADDKKVLESIGVKTQEDWQALLTELTVAREAELAAKVTAVQTDHVNKVTAAQRARVEAQQKVLDSYDKAITGSKVPNLQKYLERVLANAPKLNEGIRWAILHADDPDLVTAAVGSNRKLFDELSSYPIDKKLDRGTLSKIAAKLGREGERFQQKLGPVESVVDEPKAKPTAIKRNTQPSRRSQFDRDADGTVVIR